MRLLNVANFEFVEVWDERTEGYAILSHKWGEEEVNFKNMQNLTAASKMKGFAKIREACQQALRDQQKYIWVDTCCIDKSSSAELSEAINSMYRWYTTSNVCYAYLEDVNAENKDGKSKLQQMQSSIWFTRGWTLQELLAPQNVVFFDCQWRKLGEKRSLSVYLAQWTGVHLSVLEGTRDPPYFSIAQRMSWASKRKTARIEDTAYCLLGLLGVNMPLLYGEGKRAFLRLQLEIIKEIDDHTIFAWPIHRASEIGLLADSPASFENCRDTRRWISRNNVKPFTMTNRGLSMTFKAIPLTVDTYLVPLLCYDKNSGAWDNGYYPCLGMFLRRLAESDQYARVRFEGKTFEGLKRSTWSTKRKPGTHSIPFLSKALGSTMKVQEVNVHIRQYYTGWYDNDKIDRINGFRLAETGLLAPSREGTQTA